MKVLGMALGLSLSEIKVSRTQGCNSVAVDLISRWLSDWWRGEGEQRGDSCPRCEISSHHSEHHKV